MTVPNSHMTTAARLVALCSLAALAACTDSDSVTGPDAPPRETEPPLATLPATGLTRADLVPEGEVTPTADGFSVEGALTVRAGDGTQLRFVEADVRVRLDASDRVTSISGRVQIPPPHERVSFAEPVRADVGLFTGRYLNEHRDLGIRLKDDTDYFVYDVATAFEMRIATGETGATATKPVRVRPPLGGRVLMIADYRDPMYYVYGAQDLIGEAGTGWSRNGRIPFVPAHSVANLGAFDGTNTRVGTMTIYKILSVSGQIVDNDQTELNLSSEDPFASNLRREYQAGFNGELALDLALKEIVGIEVPISEGSGGVRVEASVQDGLRGFAFVKGRTPHEASWWPAFIPARPVTELDVEGFVTHTGDFEVGLAGEYGWDLPAGRQSMLGSFTLSDDALTLQGGIRSGDQTLAVGGTVTRAATTLFVEPPQALLDRIHADVNAEILPRIDEAQKQWEQLKKATSDYEFELSLRGLRTQLPAIVDQAKKSLNDGIESALSRHRGEVYYNSLRSHLRDADDPYHAALDRLRAAALDARDDARTRATIEAALRDLAGRKTFRTTYRYTVLGITVATVNVNRRIMSDANAERLIAAANNVKHIQETSNRRISLGQIYAQVPDRQLFEQVRADIQDGLLVMRTIAELGVVIRHDRTPAAFEPYAVIDGRRHTFDALSALTVEELAQRLPAVMVDALTSN
jgi:hypothetical protein